MLVISKVGEVVVQGIRVILQFDKNEGIEQKRQINPYINTCRQLQCINNNPVSQLIKLHNVINRAFIVEPNINDILN